MKTIRPALLLAALGIVPTMAVASCGSAFCTVNSNWTAQSAAAQAGTSYDLRYEYINQSDIFQVGDQIAFGAVHHHHDEVSTSNRNLVASINHNFGSGWGVTVLLPVAEREHFHIHNHHGAALPDKWNFTELGDVRVVGRYQLASVDDPLHPSNTGVTFGLKLPTGKINVKNGAGAEAERPLQPGSGTTDLVLGAYHNCRLTDKDMSLFAQFQYQHAINSRADFKPGAATALDLGVRKGVSEKLGVLFQLNFVHKAADSGGEAEPADSGGRFIHASPGVAYALGDNAQMYAFYQHPLLRHVNGVQLTQSRSFVVGVAGRF